MLWLYQTFLKSRGEVSSSSNSEHDPDSSQEKAKLALPQFSKKAFRKVPDAKGRVFDPFECGGMDLMESVRLRQGSGLSNALRFLCQSVQRKPPCLRRSGFAQAGRKHLQPAPLRPELATEDAFGDCPTG